MKGCPFCDLIANDGVLILNGRVAAFRPLNPVVAGHRLFVPVHHFEHRHVGSPMVVAECAQAAAEHGARQEEDFNLITSSGPFATQTIPHLHVHYVPRRPGDLLALPWTGQKWRTT